MTDHGRKRYIERLGWASDDEIVAECTGNPYAVWKDDGDGILWLVTVLSQPAYPG